MTEVPCAMALWKPLTRDFTEEKARIASSGTLVIIDPLSESAFPLDRRKAKVQEVEKAEFIDPLGATIDNETPSNREVEMNGRLSNALNDSLAFDGTDRLLNDGDNDHLPDFEPWTTKRTSILQKFTTNEKLSITTSFLPNGIPLDSHLVVVNRPAHRLEQLDDETGMKRLADLTQEEYVKTVNEMRQVLLSSWMTDRRVQALKIAIQLAKLLGSTTVPSFYPSQFVLVTDLLDAFGRLVSVRLLHKANEDRSARGQSPISDSFRLKDIPESTRETAVNWFYKIASIRELLPRFYAETSIISCLRFCEPEEALEKAMLRLAGSLRGVSNGMVAAYARCYLSRTAMRILPDMREVQWKLFHDWLQSRSSQAQSVNVWPAMEWLLQCVCYRASHDDLLPLWEYCKIKERRSLLLIPLLASLPSSYLVANAVEVSQIVFSDEISPGELCTLGKRVLDVDSLGPEVKRLMLGEAWKRIRRINNSREYVDACVIWLDFAARNFGGREVNAVLDNLIHRLTPEKQYESFSEPLLGMLNRLLQSSHDIPGLLAVERFQAFFDLLHSRFLTAATAILNALNRNHGIRTCTQYSFANLILGVCKRVHDSIGVDGSMEERRSISTLIERSLDCFDLDSEPEQALIFYSDARSYFPNLDRLIQYVILRVCGLAISVRQRSDGRRASADLLRACVASLYITIASVHSPDDRFRLYLRAGEISLIANCLPQADAIMKSVIELIASVELACDSEIFLALCSNFLSIVFLVPDAPDRPPLFLFSAFLNALDRRQTIPPVVAGELRLRCLHWLFNAGQAEYPCGIRFVRSNDAVHGGCEEFREAMALCSSRLLKDLDGILARDDCPVELPLDLLNTMVNFSQPVVDSMDNYEMLWKKSGQLGDSETRRKSLLWELERAKEKFPDWNELLKRIN